MADIQNGGPPEWLTQIMDHMYTLTYTSYRQTDRQTEAMKNAMSTIIYITTYATCHYNPSGSAHIPLRSSFCPLTNKL